MSQFSKRHFQDIDIKILINQYKKYDCLWNINSPDYKSKSSKQKAWLEIAHYFQKEVNEVKRKVQYLRTAYVHEKRKVDASRKSGSKTPYKPSLFYYKELDFLDNIVIWRKFGNDSKTAKLCFESVEISQDDEENEEEFIAFESKEELYLKEPEINCKTEVFAEPELNILPPRMPKNSTPKIFHTRPLLSQPEKRKLSPKNELKISSPTNVPVTYSAAPLLTKNLYISFGKTIALQLQHLPQEVAIMTMSEIHTILTEKALEHVRSLQNSRESWSHSESEDNYSDLIDESLNDSS